MALSEQQKQQLNEDATRIREDLATGKGWLTECFDRLFRMLQQYYSPIYKKKSPWDEQCFEDSFSDSLLSALKNYDGSDDFFTYFNTVLNNKIKSTKKKIDKDNVRVIVENGDTKYERISISVDDIRSDENKEGKSEFDVADSFNLEEDSGNRFELLDWLTQQCDMVMVQKKRYANKKTYCYSPLFFSDTVTFIAAESSRLLPYINKISNVIDLATDIRFIRFFLSDEYQTIIDAARIPCKPLGKFTGNPEDMDKDARIVCKDKLERLQNVVYVTFMRDFENKSVSEPAITQHWGKFRELMLETK